MSYITPQMPWVPRGAVMEPPGASSAEEEASLQYSPWFRLFQNAYAFSMAQQEREARVE